MNTYLHLKDIAKTKEDSILMQQEYQTALLMLQQWHMSMWDYPRKSNKVHKCRNRAVENLWKHKMTN